MAQRPAKHPNRDAKALTLPIVPLDPLQLSGARVSQAWQCPGLGTLDSCLEL